MQDIASIGFSVDTTQLKKGQVELDKLAVQGLKTEKTVDAITKSSKGATGGFKVMKGATQQLSYQLQDVAVQTQMGTSAFTILAQQGPQIASIFGPAGAAMGAIVAIGAAISGGLVGAMMSAEEEADVLAERIKNLTNELDGFGDELADIKLFNLTDQLFTTVEAIDDADARLKSLKESLALDIDQDVMMSDKEFKKRSKAIQDQQLEVDLLEAKYDRVNNTLSNFNDILEDGDDILTESEREAKRRLDTANRVIKSLSEQVDMFGMSRAEIIRYTAAMDAAEAPTNALALAILAQGEELARLTEEQEAAKVAAKEFQKAQAEAAKEAERLEREYERTFESISDNITDVIMDFENLGSVATSIAKQIARSFLQNQIVNPILGGLGLPGAPSAASSGMNLLSSGSSLLDIGSMFGTAAQGLSYFTAGGASAQQAAMLAAQTGGDAAFGAMTMESLGASGAGAGAGGFAAAIPAAGLAAIAALIITDIFEGSPPKLTFAQGDTGQESVAFDITTLDTGEMGSFEYITTSFKEQFGAYIETAFGRFGILDNSFSKKVDEQALDAMFKIVTALDESFASVIGDVSGISLTSRFLPEGSYAGRVDGRNEGETPEEQLINRYSQIIEQALPEAFKQQLMKPDMTLESIAVGITALDQASTFFGESLTELEQSFKDGALEGETFEAAFGRAIQQATADMQDFIASINGTFSAIAGLSSFATSVREDMMTDDELYKKLKDTADELGASILSLTDPDEITKAVNEYTALSSRAWGLLDESQRAAMGDEFASALDSVIADANSKTQELIEQETQNLSSADAFSASAEAMSQNADKFTSAVDLFVQAVQDMAQSQGVQGFEVTA